jgi:competence protein ComFC
MSSQKLQLHEYFLRFLFPPRCICCDTLLPFKNPMELCSDCRENLPVMHKFEHRTPDGTNIGKVYCVFGYEKGIRKAIHNLKFSDRPGNAATLVDLSYSYLERFFADNSVPFMPLPVYDIILCVPMHPGRKRKRGYNQSELLAERLARRMNIPALKKVMVKAVNTPAQSALGKAGRFRNLIGAFKVKAPDLVKGKRILLVDDVMTTGNTLEQCGKVLKDEGAIQVDAFVVAMRRKLSG